MPLSHKQRGQRSINFLFQNVKLLPEEKRYSKFKKQATYWRKFETQQRSNVWNKLLLKLTRKTASQKNGQKGKKVIHK